MYELLLTTDHIRAQIHNRASEADIRATAMKDGMRTLREDGERWIADGTTTLAELRSDHDPFQNHRLSNGTATPVELLRAKKE